MNCYLFCFIKVRISSIYRPRVKNIAAPLGHAFIQANRRDIWLKGFKALYKSTVGNFMEL
jgi:hypothetical protein